MNNKQSTLALLGLLFTLLLGFAQPSSAAWTIMPRGSVGLDTSGVTGVADAVTALGAASVGTNSVAIHAPLNQATRLVGPEAERSVREARALLVEVDRGAARVACRRSDQNELALRRLGAVLSKNPTIRSCDGQSLNRDRARILRERRRLRSGLGSISPTCAQRKDR